MADLIEYTSFGGIFPLEAGNIPEPITSKQKLEGLKAHFAGNKEIQLLSENIAQVGNEKYQFYIGRETKNSPIPWYAMSSNTYNKLRDKNIEKVVFLFWERQEKGGYAPLYTGECTLKELVFNETENKIRLNFRKESTKAGGYQYVTPSCVLTHKGNKSMAKDAE